MPGLLICRHGVIEMARQTKNQKKRSFHQELVLNRWVLGFFQGGTLAALRAIAPTSHKQMQ